MGCAHEQLSHAEPAAGGAAGAAGRRRFEFLRARRAETAALRREICGRRSFRIHRRVVVARRRYGKQRARGNAVQLARAIDGAGRYRRVFDGAGTSSDFFAAASHQHRRSFTFDHCRAGRQCTACVEGAAGRLRKSVFVGQQSRLVRCCRERADCSRRLVAAPADRRRSDDGNSCRQHVGTRAPAIGSLSKAC